ncbi:J domain-containing protein [Bradyrhizobium australiense]|uniref:J domain-containing protein n=1 Tax=Bradyrhizobium australiense TaxID=2721161 RepID=A0A7Y4LW97_9BRAD|nr:J domain-containing protein [Bradyrhizobium australiense]NOJ41237.1 J domain-containing protein [Bradyrhizobium australiense]
MGTLYDLLGALPSDDAEELRKAFRKAAKSTHPDVNPDNPDAALRFRELVRAYDILTDAEQRATYDELLAIALQPPATNAIRTYETVRKVASNTMAATVISAVLVGGYTVFGLFSKPPGAAEMLADRTASGAQEVAAAQPDAPAQDEVRIQRDGEASTGGAVALASAAKELATAALGRFEPVPAFATYNLGVQYYPRFAAAYFDRGLVLYRMADSDRPLADIAATKRATDLRRSKSATSPPVPRKPLTIVPTLPERREPITAALTP